MKFIAQLRSPALIFIGLCIAASPAGAGVADFYKGKTVQLIIGSSAGGGFDAYGRLVARHIGGHIPGNPDVLPVNMPGAASANAVRLIQARPKDGSVIVAFNPSLILKAITDPKRMHIDFKKLAYLGSVSSNVGVCFVWHTKGIRTWDDLAKKKHPLVFGAPGSKGSSVYIEGALMKNLFGLPVKVITGYPGSTEVNLAVRHGELDGSCGTWQSLPAEWRKNNWANVIYTYSKVKPAGIDAPYLLDLAKNENQKKMLRLVIGYNDVFRPLAVAKEIPQDRLKALRDALWATVNDKAFKSEAARLGRPIISPKRGEEMQKTVAEIYETPSDVVAAAVKAIK